MWWQRENPIISRYLLWPIIVIYHSYTPHLHTTSNDLFQTTSRWAANTSSCVHSDTPRNTSDDSQTAVWLGDLRSKDPHGPANCCQNNTKKLATQGLHTKVGQACRQTRSSKPPGVLSRRNPRWTIADEQSVIHHMSVRSLSKQPNPINPMLICNPTNIRQYVYLCDNGQTPLYLYTSCMR